MVRAQLEARGIRDSRVLRAMATVPRELFVPPSLRCYAYLDAELPLGTGETLSRPATIARLLEALELTGNERALVVGSGVGYQAALLHELAGTVVLLEGLPVRARRDLMRAGFAAVPVHGGDGRLGVPEQGPFDAIAVWAAVRTIPPALVRQLALGGRLVAPVGGRLQTLRRLRKGLDGRVRDESMTLCAFHPLRHPSEGAGLGGTPPGRVGDEGTS
jgi:protein-L-isoaspartate(D-aspartate) O-methyltransferase